MVNFIATQLIDWTKSFPGLGYADVAYTRVTEVALPAGTWNITNVISRDGYDTRIYTGVQLSEIWEIEFLGSDGSVLARSNPTGDVPDGIAYGEWIGDLGTVTLPEGVVAVRGHHLPDLVPEDPETANSVMPITFTICSDDGSLNTSSTTTPGSTTTVSSTTPGSTSTVSSTIPSSTPQPTVTSAPGSTAPLVSSATTVPGRGVGSGVLNSGATNNPPKTTNVGVNLLGSEIPAQVLGTSVNSGSLNSGTTSTSNSNLAITGSTVRPLIVAAISLIALGGLLALGARRRRD